MRFSHLVASLPPLVAFVSLQACAEGSGVADPPPVASDPPQGAGGQAGMTSGAAGKGGMAQGTAGQQSAGGAAPQGGTGGMTTGGSPQAGGAGGSAGNDSGGNTGTAGSSQGGGGGDGGGAQGGAAGGEGGQAQAGSSQAGSSQGGSAQGGEGGQAQAGAAGQQAAGQGGASQGGSAQGGEGGQAQAGSSQAGQAGAAGQASGGAAGQGGSGAAGSSSTPTLLVVGAAPKQASAFAATFTAADGWKTLTPSPGVVSGTPGVVGHQGGIMAFVRVYSSAKNADVVSWARYTPSSGLGAFAALPNQPQATDGIAATASPNAPFSAWAVFLQGGEETTATFDGTTFSVAKVAPPSKPATVSSVAAAIAAAGSDIWVIHPGKFDEGMYAYRFDGTKWLDAEPISGVGTKQTISPHAVVMPAGNLMLAYVDNKQSQICIVERASAGWTAPACVPGAITSRKPAFFAHGSGTLYVAWHGYDNDNIYAAVKQNGAWSAPIEIDAGAGAAGAPVLAEAVPQDATVELLYAKGGTFEQGGKVRHVRLSGAQATAPVEVGGVGITEVGAAMLSP